MIDRYNDVAFLSGMGFLFFIWVIGEFFFRKSKDATWIQKARGNKPVREYRESIAGQKFGELSEIEKQQLISALKNETFRYVFRWAPWILIIMLLIIGAE